MAASSHRGRSFSAKSWENRESEEEEDGHGGVKLFDVYYGKMREKVVLQRLIVAGRLPARLNDRRQLGAHYEKLHFELSKHYIWDHMTGLLLIYPTHLLHIIESTREVLVSVLKDMQQQPGCALLEAPKVVFLANDTQSRMFPQWSYKVLQADQCIGDSKDVDEENTDTLVCSVLSALRKLEEKIDITKADPGSVLDGSPELIVPPEVLESLLTRDELQTPQQHLQLYHSPLNVTMESGQVIRSSFLTTV